MRSYPARDMRSYADKAVGPIRGLLGWQRSMCARHRGGQAPAVAAPYRWATYVATRSSAAAAYATDPAR